jgi:hypothetical protein
MQTIRVLFEPTFWLEKRKGKKEGTKENEEKYKL